MSSSLKKWPSNIRRSGKISAVTALVRIITCPKTASWKRFTSLSKVGRKDIEIEAVLTTKDEPEEFIKGFNDLVKAKLEAKEKHDLVSQLSVNNDRLSSQIKSLAAENETLKAKAGALSEEVVCVKALVGRVALLEAQSEKLPVMNNKLEEVKSALSTDVTELAIKLGYLWGRVDDLDTQNNSLLNENKKLKHQTSALAERTTSLEKELEAKAFDSQLEINALKPIPTTATAQARQPSLNRWTDEVTTGQEDNTDWPAAPWSTDVVIKTATEGGVEGAALHNDECKDDMGTSTPLGGLVSVKEPLVPNKSTIATHPAARLANLEAPGALEGISTERDLAAASPVSLQDNSCAAQGQPQQPTSISTAEDCFNKIETTMTDHCHNLETRFNDRFATLLSAINRSEGRERMMLSTIRNLSGALVKPRVEEEEDENFGSDSSWICWSPLACYCHIHGKERHANDPLHKIIDRFRRDNKSR
jgi:regulator of replication initiation timing